MWHVEIHPLVWKEDFARLDQPTQDRITQAIRKRLSLDPKAYGKRLRGPLAGFWRLRVGDYRIIYLIHEQRITVIVVKVGIRRDEEVYLSAYARLRNLGLL